MGNPSLHAFPSHSSTLLSTAADRRFSMLVRGSCRHLRDVHPFYNVSRLRQADRICITVISYLSTDEAIISFSCITSRASDPTCAAAGRHVADRSSNLAFAEISRISSSYNYPAAGYLMSDASLARTRRRSVPPIELKRYRSDEGDTRGTTGRW